MQALRLLMLATALVGLSTQDAPAQRGGASNANTNPLAYVYGKVARTKTIAGRLCAEFDIKSTDGLRTGDRLVVIRPSAANAFVDEIVVQAVNSRQAVGTCRRREGVEPGDAVIFQRMLDLDKPINAKGGIEGEIYVEISFWTPPQGETRKTFNARIERVTWEGMLDIRDFDALVYLETIGPARMNIAAESVKQLRINGLVLVVDQDLDKREGTLVAAAIHDYRQVVRADVAERRRIEIAKAQIASDERVRIAKVQADADASVRIAAARARAEADMEVRLAEVNARSRLERDRLAQDFELARERIAANDRSNGLLSRALTAAGAVLQVSTYVIPQYAAVLEGASKGTALVGALLPFLP